MLTAMTLDADMDLFLPDDDLGKQVTVLIPPFDNLKIESHVFRVRRVKRRLVFHPTCLSIEI